VIAMRAADQISNTPLIANARMYSSGAPEAGAAWTSLLNWVVARAGCGFEVLDYPPPRPLDAFWARADLGCAFMCGLPYARDPRPLTPIDPDLVGKLQAAFKAAARADALEAERDMLLIADFVVPERAVYEALRARAEAAAAYPDVW